MFASGISICGRNKLASNAAVAATQTYKRCVKKIVPKTPYQNAALHTVADSAIADMTKTFASALLIAWSSCVMASSFCLQGVADVNFLPKRSWTPPRIMSYAKRF
jgi:hypothetical protein